MKRVKVFVGLFFVSLLLMGMMSLPAVPQTNAPARVYLDVSTGIWHINAGSLDQLICVPNSGQACNLSTIMTTLGDTIYGGASGADTRLAGNTTSTKKFLNQTGNGTISAAPAWGTIALADLPKFYAALGDTSYGGAAGANTVLSGNITSAKQFLTQTGTGAVSAAPAWGALAITDVPSIMQACGTTSTCAHTAVTSPKFAFGSAPLVSASPSAVTITGISPAFTSATSYKCTLTNETSAAHTALTIAYVDGTSFTITGPNTLTDTIGYVCVGN